MSPNKDEMTSSGNEMGKFYILAGGRDRNLVACSTLVCLYVCGARGPCSFDRPYAVPVPLCVGIISFFCQCLLRIGRLDI